MGLSPVGMTVSKRVRQTGGGPQDAVPSVSASGSSPKRFEELWAELRGRGLQLLPAKGGEVELFALHSDGTTRMLRYIEL